MRRALIKVTVKLLGQPLKSTYFASDNPIVAAGLNFNHHSVVSFIKKGFPGYLESIRNCAWSLQQYCPS